MQSSNTFFHRSISHDYTVGNLTTNRAEKIRYGNIKTKKPIFIAHQTSEVTLKSLLTIFGSDTQSVYLCINVISNNVILKKKFWERMKDFIYYYDRWLFRTKYTWFEPTQHYLDYTNFKKQYQNPCFHTFPFNFSNSQSQKGKSKRKLKKLKLI